jgi:hypothetical protein
MRQGAEVIPATTSRTPNRVEQRRESATGDSVMATAIDKKTLKTKRQLLTDRQRKQRLRERKQRIAHATKAIYSLLREHFDNPYEAYETLVALVEHLETEYHCYGFPDIWSEPSQNSDGIVETRRSRGGRSSSKLTNRRRSTVHNPLCWRGQVRAGSLRQKRVFSEGR